MTKEQNALIGLISEALKYANSDKVEFYWDLLLKPELSEQGLVWAFDELIRKDVVTRYQIGYEDPKAPPKSSAKTSAPTNTHTRAHYTLWLNIQKFEKLKESRPTSERKSGFIDETAQLKIDGTTIQLPPHKNEHWLCKGAFEYSVGEPIDWEELYEKITGYYQAFYGKPKTTRANQRLVYDAMEAINQRIIDKGLEPLFNWQEKTLRRNR